MTRLPKENIYNITIYQLDIMNSAKKLDIMKVTKPVVLFSKKVIIY